MPRSLALTVVIALAGCSFFLKPTGYKAVEDPDCQPYIVVPIVDGLVGAVATTWALTTACDEGARCVFGLSVGAALVTAAVIGVLKVRACERAQKKQARFSRRPDRDGSGIGLVRSGQLRPRHA